jgi:RHS repeat-associated protein
MWCYDGLTFSYANVTACIGGPITASAGKLTGYGFKASSMKYEHDSLGRVSASEQRTLVDGSTCRFTYSYYLCERRPGCRDIPVPARGDELLRRPGPREVGERRAYQRRLHQRNDGPAAQAYASNLAYAPHGAIQQLQLGSQLYEQTCFNARLQTGGIRLGTGITGASGSGCANSGSDLLNLSYGYVDASARNNGNMQTQTISRSGMVGDYQYYGYDPLNRLRFAAEYAAPTTPSGTPCSDGGQHWCEGYTVDPVGNRILSSGHSEPQAPASFNQYNQAVTAAGGGSFAYDGRGNQITTAGVTPQSSFGYDAENRQVAYCPSGTTPCTTGISATFYVYDAAGLRVAKGTSIYVHDSQGQLSAEYQTTGTPGTQYLTADAIGSTRMITDGNGTVQNCKDYYPYGGEIPASAATGRSGSCWTDLPETLRFTGKERDAETGLDYFGARYFSGGQGRWTSPDWSEKVQAVPYAEFSDPQTLNLYGYVRNNPLDRRDADGHVVVVDDAAIAAAAIGTVATLAVLSYVSQPANQRSLSNAISSAIDKVGGWFHPNPATPPPAGTPPSTPANMSTGAPASTGTSLQTGAPGTPANSPAGVGGPITAVGNNPRESNGRILTDLPGGHDAAKQVFGQLTTGQTVKLDPKTGQPVSDNGVRLRLNPDGTARVDIPQSAGTELKHETVHFNNPDK